MAVGTTDTFVSTRDEIISDALSKLGAIGPGEDATGVIRTHAARRLDAIVKEIDADGQFLWRMQRLTTTTTASTATVTISALAMDIDEPIRFTKAGATTGVPLHPMTRDEYMAIPDRTSVAETPTRYYIEKSLSTGRAVIALYLWPEPSDTGDTVEYAAALRAKDFNTGATNPDFPSSWTRCLGFGLAADLAPDYKQWQQVAVFQPQYERLKDKLLNTDNEKQGLVMVPFGGVY
jgi:hypothetical protein